MKLSAKSILVVTNPFAAPLAPDGRCTALCPVDPRHPMGRDYIGARTMAETVNGPRSAIGVGAQGQGGKRGPTRRLTRDKVRVAYDLRPVSVPDTSFYRAKIESGEVFEVDGAPGKLISAARAALAAFEVAGGSREQALQAWATQGVGSIAALPAVVHVKGQPAPPPTPTQDAGTEPDPGVHTPATIAPAGA